MTLRTGTRIEVPVTYPGYAPERAKIARWHKSYGLREELPAGYHPVRFEKDGGILMVHESRFRMVDNRA